MGVIALGGRRIQEEHTHREGDGSRKKNTDREDVPACVSMGESKNASPLYFCALPRRIVLAWRLIVVKL